MAPPARRRRHLGEGVQGGGSPLGGSGGVSGGAAARPGAPAAKNWRRGTSGAEARIALFESAAA
eukprot:5682920-Alexandrium_andersonii.AAC.1